MKVAPLIFVALASMKRKQKVQNIDLDRFASEHKFLMLFLDKKKEFGDVGSLSDLFRYCPKKYLNHLPTLCRLNYRVA